jgi:hypothetical protein
MADPYAAFSSPVDEGADPYAAFSSRVDQKQAAPPATAMDRVNAFAGGVNRGAAATVGLPVDTVANVRDLGKALAGSIYAVFTDKDGQPIPTKNGVKMFDVDENGKLVPSSTQPSVDIPQWLQIRPRDQDFGSGENIAKHLDTISNAVFGSDATTIPRPDDKASRYIYAGGAGLPAAALAPGAGPVGPLSAAARFTPSAVAGVAGSEAGQFAAEQGAPAPVQQAAGLLGAVAPSAARVAIAEGSRRLLRGGGEQARQKVAQNIQDFENAGAGTPSVGQAAESRIARSTESLLAKTPGASGRMAEKAETLAGNLGSNIERLATQLAPKASGEQAGRAITKGISGEGGFIEKFKQISTKNYDALDAHVKKDAPFALPKTAAALDELTKPIAGAEKTSKFFVNSTIRSIKDAMDADLKAGNNTIPYEAVKKIRSIVGENLADAPFAGDVPRSQWKKLYAALSDDLETNARGAGQKAQDALTRANTYHAAGMKRLDVLSTVIDKNGGPEAVFRAATSGAKEGATTLRSVMQSLPADAQKTLSASVLRRLGRAKAGSQDDLGEKFSTETFLTNWNTMSPQAKAALFDRYGAGFRHDMDAVAKVTANLRDGSAVFRNPSGTGQSLAQSTLAATAILSVLNGNFGVAGAIGGGVAAANGAARFMTNANVVKWLAKSTKAPVSALPALLNQAAQSHDADLREIARLVKEARQPNDQGNKARDRQ